MILQSLGKISARALVQVAAVGGPQNIYCWPRVHFDFDVGAGGGSRTLTLYGRWILSPVRLPFRHSGTNEKRTLRWIFPPQADPPKAGSPVRLPFRHSGTSEQLLLYRNDYTLSTIFFTISISSSFCCFQVNATTVITPCSMRSTSVGISSLSNSK